MALKKAVVWGIRPNSHTHSYIHAAFHKAFKAMGFESNWIPENTDVSNMDMSNTIFITEGQFDQGIPIREDCKYVLHNCNPAKYANLKPENILTLQVYTNDVLPRKCDNLGHGAYFMPEGRGLFQPWATDLLPNEIDLAWADAPRSNDVHWVGSMGGGQFGNIDEITQFKRAATTAGISFHCHPPGSTTFEDNLRLIKQSYMAPAIHGTWQTNVGYIACRVFKNISYGQLGSTNCKEAAALFDGNVVCNKDTYQLFFDTRSRLGDKKAITSAMQIVKDKHTYINRINTILSLF